MRKLALTALTLGLMALSTSPVAAQMEMADTEQVEFRATVVDLSCKLVYNLSGQEMHRQCAQVCADNGIPLGLLADDGTFYLPVTDGMPGQDQNSMLRGHAEHQVTVRGRKISRAGMNSIIIESVRM